MRIALNLTIVVSFFSCSTTKEKSDPQSGPDSIKKAEMVNEAKPATTDNDSVSFLRPVPIEYIVSDTVVGDSDIVVFRDKCVVFSNYSHDELVDMEKKMKEDEWEAFYDDMAFYGNEASLFLYEKTKTEMVYDKKYLKFIFATGKELTIDRKKSVESIFFFNPQKGIKKCDTREFIKEKYSGY